uniref:cell surface protein n=1 Tax=Brachyspira catarrhinii TaxID=2528966 RepID=UPI003F4BBFCA
MKKILLTAMTLLAIVSASAFGMYGRGDGWIDFLVHGNQLRARMDQFGFVLGNGTIKGTFGFKAEDSYWGQILSGQTGNIDFLPSISGGIGYTSDLIGIGLGYSYTYVSSSPLGPINVHTPVLMVNALNNNLRISIPIQIAVKEKDVSSAASHIDNLPYSGKVQYTGVSFNNIQLRYYTGIDAFNAIRVYFYYRNNTYKDENSGALNSEAFGFQTRFYFLNTTIGNVNINPFVRVDFHTALKGDLEIGDSYSAETDHGEVRAGKYIGGKQSQSDVYEKNPYIVAVNAVLGITANSDIVSLYVEPSLGYQATYMGHEKGLADNKVHHNLAWGAYTELYITPVKDLEWYFEMDINNSDSKGNGVPVNFASSTGITWYLPSFN